MTDRDQRPIKIGYTLTDELNDMLGTDLPEGSGEIAASLLSTFHPSQKVRATAPRLFFAGVTKITEFDDLLEEAERRRKIKQGFEWLDSNTDE